LTDEQGESQYSSFGIRTKERFSDQTKADGGALVNRDGFAHLWQWLAGVALDLGFDIADDFFGFVLTTVDEEPAWAFGDGSSNQQNRQSNHQAEEEGQTPPDIFREQVLVQRHDR